MLVVETIARIRREYFVKGKPIKEIVRDVKVSRNTVRKVIRSQATAFTYDRRVQPMPKLGPWTAELERMLEANETKSKRERLTLLRISEALEGLGYGGGYDAVRRYAKAWRWRRSASTAQTYVPLVFSPGEAYQFDWSHEYVVLAGVTTKVKVAHVRLCHSRMFFVRAYPRASQEMVFDAHDRAFRLFQGACRRGIYDNMKTAVQTVLIGKERAFNRRFVQMCGHYLVEPTACTPGAGWEKGQVENQVGIIRGRFFTPRLRFKTYDELNAWLLDQCVAYARRHPHPVFKDRTVWQVFEDERPSLVGYRGPFDGFHAVPASVSKTCLVRFDSNKYSVAARAVGRPVEVHAYADRIVIRQDGEIVAEHARRFGRDQTVYDPWHYVPVLARKPRRFVTARRSRTGRCPAPWVACASGSPATTTATGDGRDPHRRAGGWAGGGDRPPVPRRSLAACAAPTSCSTSSIVGASRPRRRRSRRPRTCVFALSRWPIAPATTA